MSVDDKKNCEDFQELLDAYFDQELSAKESELVEEHLNQCQNCLEKLSDLKSLLGHLKSLPEPVCPRDFSELIAERILAQGVPAAPLKEVKVLPFRPSAWLWLAAGVLLVGLSLSFAFQPAGQLAQAPAPAVTAPAPADAGQWQIASLPQDTARRPTAVAVVKGAGAQSKGASPRLAQRPAAARTNPAPAVAGVVAFYDEELDEDGSNLGISTNEDGLYAIKL